MCACMPKLFLGLQMQYSDRESVCVMCEKPGVPFSEENKNKTKIKTLPTKE